MHHTLEELLFQLGLCDFNLYRLVNLLLMSSLVVGVVLDCGREERIDEGGLSQSGLASNLEEALDLTQDSKDNGQHHVP
jgi:hypothetical protein